jgi:hypothetical protein
MSRPPVGFRYIVLLAALLTGVPSAADSRSQTFEDFTIPMPLSAGEFLIIGFVGGWERWDNETRCVRRLALRLRDLRLPGVHVETVENHKRHLAMQLVERAFPSGAADARLVLYGQSMGGAAVVLFARELHARGIPVKFAAVIDSFGRNDRFIPPNVAAAVNFFQRDGWPVRGEKEIRAEDPGRTRILGNFQYSYKRADVDISYEPPSRRRFSRAHAQMEYDPVVWARVERLLVEAVRNAPKKGDVK